MSMLFGTFRMLGRGLGASPQGPWGPQAPIGRREVANATRRSQRLARDQSKMGPSWGAGANITDVSRQAGWAG